MSTTLPPRNGDVSDGASPVPPPTVLADETALHQVFDAEFQPLLELAARELGASAAMLAPRVVEAAFVRAWDQRARFQTRNGLDAFLKEDVHHGVARTLARRAAAHRLGHHEDPTAPGGGMHAAPAANAAATAAATAVAAPSVDRETVWQHLLHTIHDQGPSLEARTHAVEVSRHDAAQHVASIAKSGAWWPWVVAALVAVVGIAGAIRWADRASAQSGVVRALAAGDARSASSGRGQMANVTLGEGSRVKLAPETRVIIPKDFGEKLRAVKLDGAATIEAKPGLENGLQVHAGNAVVTTTGTTFSVRAWPGENVVVMVSEGNVNVTANATSRAVAAGEALVVKPDGTMDAPDADTRRAAMAWTEGRLILPKQPLEQVVKQLRRWYGLDIGLADPSIGAREVSLDVPLNSPKEAVDAIEAQANVKYGYGAHNEKVFKDAPAVATPPAKGKGTTKR